MAGLRRCHVTLATLLVQLRSALAHGRNTEKSQAQGSRAEGRATEAAVPPGSGANATQPWLRRCAQEGPAEAWTPHRDNFRQLCSNGSLARAVVRERQLQHRMIQGGEARQVEGERECVAVATQQRRWLTWT